MQTLTISSDPEHAQVRVNGEKVGTTPLRVQVRRSEDVLIEARVPGHETGFRTSHRTLSTLGLVDIVGGFFLLLPFFGLLSPAAWEHEPSVYSFILDPENPSKDQ